MFELLYPLLKHALGVHGDRFTDGEGMYAFIKNYYDAYITKEEYIRLSLATEGSCAFGYAFIAWIVDSLDEEKEPSNKGTFWSKIRSTEGLMNIERAVIVENIARHAREASASASSPPSASASAMAPRHARAYFTVTISGPFVNARLSPRWRSITIEIESATRWQPHHCEKLVLYLRLVHQMIFTIPMGAASVERELRGDLNIDVGTTSDMSCDHVIKSPVFSGSLLTWRMGGAGEGHQHSMLTMKKLLIKVNVESELYLRSVIFPLLRSLAL